MCVIFVVLGNGWCLKMVGGMVWCCIGLFSMCDSILVIWVLVSCLLVRLMCWLMIVLFCMNRVVM